MKFLDYLREEFVNVFQGIKSASRVREYEVYKNPNGSDVHRLYKSILNDPSYSIRGLIDVKNKDFFVFSAVADLHVNAYSKLVGMKELSTSQSDILSFVGYIDSNKIWGETVSSMGGKTSIPTNMKFDWLKKYIANADTLEIDKYGVFGTFK